MGLMFKVEWGYSSPFCCFIYVTSRGCDRWCGGLDRRMTWVVCTTGSTIVSTSTLPQLTGTVLKLQVTDRSLGQKNSTGEMEKIMRRFLANLHGMFENI